MARGKRKVVAKDYDTLISSSKEKIEKLNTELKAERMNLKALEKEAAAYAKQLEEEKKQAELAEITKMIAESGKTPEEIKAFLSKK